MIRLEGLVAATHAPFDGAGRLNLDVVEKQADHLLRDGVAAVYVGGSTGESHSLSLVERMALTRRWAEVSKDSALPVVVHVGGNCLDDARGLAEQAQRLEVAAIAAMAPSYFKPRTLDVLIECCRTIAAAAPALPFYFYDIPVMTHVHFSMPDFLEAAAERIPTLAGLKFTNSDLVAYQRCLRLGDGRFDVPWGMDECLLAALALGGRGGVGSTYNFAAPLYLRMIAALRQGDLAAAREEQFRSVRLVQLLAGFGYMAASKAVMHMLGVPVGTPRLPHESLAAGREEELRVALERMGFFEWGRKPEVA